MDVRVNDPTDLAAFTRLNLAWIDRYFQVEASDRKVLDQPARIIADGGFVLTLVDEGEVVGCCALLRNGERSFELAKMAVDPAVQGRGLGDRLMLAAVAQARSAGADRLDLLTSSKLTVALALYRKHGFEQLPQTCHADYARCDVVMRRLL